MEGKIRTAPSSRPSALHMLKILSAYELKGCIHSGLDPSFVLYSQSSLQRSIVVIHQGQKGAHFDSSGPANSLCKLFPPFFTEVGSVPLSATQEVENKQLKLDFLLQLPARKKFHLLIFFFFF